MTVTAWGVELDDSGEMGALVAARARDGGGWRVEVLFYQPGLLLPAAVGAAYDGEPDGVGVFADPMLIAPVLEELRNRVWLHTMEAVDVAAAAGQFRAAVKGRLVTAGEHPALEQALTFAMRRSLASAFGFERRRVPCDMSPLNAASFALWGLRRNEAAAEPGVWVI
jgi:hypothetical protein